MNIPSNCVINKNWMISHIVVTTVDIFTQLATRFFFLGFLMFVAYKIVSIFRSCNLGNVVKKKGLIANYILSFLKAQESCML